MLPSADTGPALKQQVFMRTYSSAAFPRGTVTELPAILSHFKLTSPDIPSHAGSIGAMTYEAELTGLAAVLLPTLMVLRFDHLRSEGTETTLAQVLANIESLVKTRGYIIKAQIMLLVVGLLLGAKVKQFARQEVEQNRRNSRAVLAQSFLTLSRLAGDQGIHTGLTCAKHVARRSCCSFFYTACYLTEPLRGQFQAACRATTTDLLCGRLCAQPRSVTVGIPCLADSGTQEEG